MCDYYSEFQKIYHSSIYLGMEVPLVFSALRNLKGSTKMRILAGELNLDVYGRIFMKCQQATDFDAAVNKQLDNLI